MENKAVTTEQLDEAKKAAQMAVNHNIAEINRELDKHFNGSDKNKKNALANVETVFGNLAKVGKK